MTNAELQAAIATVLLCGQCGERLPARRRSWVYAGSDTEKLFPCCCRECADWYDDAAAAAERDDRLYGHDPD